MTKKLLFTLYVCLLASLAGAQATPVQPTASVWSGNYAYDFAVNKPLALASYSLYTAQEPTILADLFPKTANWSFATTVFTGSYIGGTGIVAGTGFQFSTVFHSLTLSAGAGEGFVSGGKGPHIIAFFGGSVPIK